MFYRLPMLRFVVGMLLVGLMVLGAGAASGQTTYPNKPIRIVASGPGGGNDFTARVIAQGLNEYSGGLGQQVIVENRGGTLQTAPLVAKAAPDGYTLLVQTGILWLGPFLRDNVPYDASDFLPITLLASSPNILVVHPSLPVRSVKELIALAKARPGELNYSSASTGGSGHLAAELFKYMAGVNIMRIYYRNGSLRMASLIGGEVQMEFATAGSVGPYVKSGRLRALAVTSAERSALTPDLPTVAASGLPGYESGTMYGMFAPARTPAALINRLNQEVVRVLARPEVKEKFLNVGVEVIGSSPEQFAATIKSDMTKMGKVIKDAGIREE